MVATIHMLQTGEGLLRIYFDDHANVVGVFGVLDEAAACCFVIVLRSATTQRVSCLKKCTFVGTSEYPSQAGCGPDTPTIPDEDVFDTPFPLCPLVPACVILLF
jgi:hypothetical protein